MTGVIVSFNHLPNQVVHTERVLILDNIQPRFNFLVIYRPCLVVIKLAAGLKQCQLHQADPERKNSAFKTLAHSFQFLRSQENVIKTAWTALHTIQIILVWKQFTVDNLDDGQLILNAKVDIFKSDFIIGDGDGLKCGVSSNGPSNYHIKLLCGKVVTLLHAVVILDKCVGQNIVEEQQYFEFIFEEPVTLLLYYIWVMRQVHLNRIMF